MHQGTPATDDRTGVNALREADAGGFPRARWRRGGRWAIITQAIDPSPQREPAMPAPLDRKDVGPVTILRINTPMLWGDQTSDELFDQLVALVENSDRRQIVLDVG